MATPLRLLHVEDVESDSKLLLRALRTQGYEPSVERVETPEAMRAALALPGWELVISDWALPRFDGLAAFRVAEELRPDLPFIIISGTIGEETAVAAMRAGVHDFMLKGNLARLGPVIDRELREAALRRERKQMEQKLAVSERLASVGLLAAGVAHEVNNPLAYVLANIDFAITEGSATQGADVQAALRDARDGAQRIAAIVRDLKLFSRGDDEQPGTVELAPVVESALSLAGNQVHHRAQLVKELGPVPPVDGSARRLAQVVLNLLINAAQAIPEGQAQAHEIRVTLKTVGGAAVLEIRDTGCGMPAAVREKLFQPFFTTKPVGVGTGLGLSICLGTVRGMGGDIQVESEVGRGTTFRLIFPAGKLVAPAARPPVEAAPTAAPARKARILVVDDELAIVRALQRSLAPEHEVTGLTESREALARLCAGETYDLVICDLMMPDLTGMELHAEVERARPEQARRFVFATGGAFSHQARQFLEKWNDRQIGKPFDVQNVQALVARLVS